MRYEYSEDEYSKKYQYSKDEYSQKYQCSKNYMYNSKNEPSNNYEYIQ